MGTTKLGYLNGVVGRGSGEHKPSRRNAVIGHLNRCEGSAPVNDTCGE